MKKILTVCYVSTLAILISCGGAETKVDPVDTANSNDNVQPNDTVQRQADDKAPSSEPRSGAADSNVNSEKNDILSNIDKHLVSTIQVANGANSGTAIVENTLPDATFQRAILEISEVDATGAAQKTDFYTVINLEPGGKKTVKLNSLNPGAKLTAHIVKAKSAQLTNGEMILVGSRYSPQ